MTILLTYENKELILAETRGNGEEGEIITHNARVFENIPLHIDYTGHLEIEGEAIITYDDFEEINSKLPDNEKYKNPRNLVSGSVRQLDSNIAAQRHIKFIAWKVPKTTDSREDKYFANKLAQVKELGFDIVPYLVYFEDTIENRIENLKNTARELGYPIDGLVMTYNDIIYGKSLGATGHHPKHSLAFKFYDDVYPTRLLDVEFTMGKTGILTPTAVFEPVEIDGTTVERASLHNISIMKSLYSAQWYEGLQLDVYKANQIIPQIKKVYDPNCICNRRLFIPEKCPICGGKTSVIKEKSTEVLVCTNLDCKGKLLGKLSHFVSKNAINIDGLSEHTLQKFIDLGWLNSFQDIYYLSKYKDEMCKLDGFGKKSVDKLLECIEKSRNVTLDRLIYALCIPLIGRSASKDISKACANGDIHQFVTIMSLEGEHAFIGLNGFGKEMCKSLVHWWTHNKELFYNLINEFNFKKTEKKSTNADLSGKNFVITGTLNHYKNRDELTNIIESMGGKVSGSVSVKTSYLLNNNVDSTSSKNKKAKDLGVPIISEEDFIRMIS